MGLAARMIYVGMLACCGVIFVISAIAGIWIWAIAAAIFGLVLAVTAPFVLGQKWRPDGPKARTRAVSRRRR
jgi:hypothetical protein